MSSGELHEKTMNQKKKKKKKKNKNKNKQIGLVVFANNANLVMRAQM